LWRRLWRRRWRSNLMTLIVENRTAVKIAIERWHRNVPIVKDPITSHRIQERKATPFMECRFSVFNPVDFQLWIRPQWVLVKSINTVSLYCLTSCLTTDIERPSDEGRINMRRESDDREIPSDTISHHDHPKQNIDTADQVS
jgi:hypothetical protein